MWVTGSIYGNQILTRKMRLITDTVIAGQLVSRASTSAGEIHDPSSVNSYAVALGVTFEAATYAATSPGQFVKCSIDPFQIIRGKASGGTASDTAWSAAQLLTTTSASATEFADTAVSTIDYGGGFLVMLTGTRAGELRVQLTQHDNTHTIVTVPFSGTGAVGDTALRTYGIGVRGVELTTDFSQFNNLLAGGEALGDALGESEIWNIYIDDQATSGQQSISKINIHNPTAPLVDFEVILLGQIYNNMA